MCNISHINFKLLNVWKLFDLKIQLNVDSENIEKDYKYIIYEIFLILILNYQMFENCSI